MNRDVAYVLDKIVLGGIFLLPFLPLIITTGLFFPYITGKAFFFRFIVEVIFACWALLAIYDERYRPKIGYLFLAVLAWFLVTVLASLLGADVFRSFFSNFERMEGVITYLHLTAYFVVLVSVLISRNLWKYLFYTSVGASLLVVFYGLGQMESFSQIFQGGGRMESTLGNAAYLAAYMSLHVFIVAWLWLSARSRNIQIFYCLVTFLYLFVIYQTATRGAVLGLIAGVGIVTLLLALFERENKRLRQVSAGALLLTAVLVGGFWALRDLPVISEHRVLGRFASISLEEQTSRSRIMIWQMALIGVAERPMLGYGSDNFRYVFGANYNPRMYDQEQWFDRTHNAPLDWLVATGGVGFLVYLSLFFFSLLLVWRATNFSLREKSILIAFLVAYLVQMMFLFDNIVTYYLLFVVFAFIYTQSSDQKNFEVFRGFSGLLEGGLARQVVASLVIISSLFVFYISVAKPALASMYLVEALKATQVDPARALEFFEKTINYNTIGRVEAIEQMTMAVPRILSNESIPEETRQAFAESVYRQWQEQIIATPNDARVYVFFGSFLSMTGQFDEAIRMFERALELSPDKQSILLELASVYVNQGEIEEALEIVDYAVGLAPGNREAIRLYAVLTFMIGETETAEEILLEEFGTLAVNDDRLLNLYVAEERFDLVSEIWQQRVGRDRGNLQAWFSYAGSFIIQNEIEQAVGVLEEAKEYLPENLAELDEAIRAVRAGEVQVNF